MNAKIVRFDEAAQAYAMVGSLDPEIRPIVEREYKAAKASLQGYINYLEYQEKQAKLFAPLADEYDEYDDED